MPKRHYVRILSLAVALTVAAPLLTTWSSSPAWAQWDSADDVKIVVVTGGIPRVAYEDGAEIPHPERDSREEIEAATRLLEHSWEAGVTHGGEKSTEIAERIYRNHTEALYQKSYRTRELQGDVQYRVAEDPEYPRISKDDCLATKGDPDFVRDPETGERWVYMPHARAGCVADSYLVRFELDGVPAGSMTFDAVTTVYTDNAAPRADVHFSIANVTYDNPLLATLTIGLPETADDSALRGEYVEYGVF